MPKRIKDFEKNDGLRKAKHESKKPKSHKTDQSKKAKKNVRVVGVETCESVNVNNCCRENHKKEFSKEQLFFHLMKIQ